MEGRRPIREQVAGRCGPDEGTGAGLRDPVLPRLEDTEANLGRKMGVGGRSREGVRGRGGEEGGIEKPVSYSEFHYLMQKHARSPLPWSLLARVRGRGGKVEQRVYASGNCFRSSRAVDAKQIGFHYGI